MAPTILVVEDEPVMAEVVERYLRRDGYEVAVARDGYGALDAFDRVRPALVVLDIMLPGVDGFEVCRQIRATSGAAVIMLTARTEEVDKLLALGLGADDYVTKPFSPRELAARIKAVLRRTAAAPGQAGDELHFDRLQINSRTRTVHDGSAVIELTAREFDLLWFLASHPGQVFTRDQILDAVWDREFVGEEGTVTVHVRRLRAKVESDPSRPRYLKTVWGIGYKFEP